MIFFIVWPRCPIFMTCHWEPLGDWAIFATAPNPRWLPHDIMSLKFCPKIILVNLSMPSLINNLACMIHKLFRLYISYILNCRALKFGEAQIYEVWSKLDQFWVCFGCDLLKHEGKCLVFTVARRMVNLNIEESELDFLPKLNSENLSLMLDATFTLVWPIFS